MSSNPTITINLNPVLEGYCRWIFNCKKGDIPINRSHVVGMHIYSKVITERKRPNIRPAKINPVTFILPITENNWREFKTKHVFITAFEEEQITDFIDADYRAWCRAKFESGYLSKYTRNEITATIARIINVRGNQDNFEMIKKNDYRRRVKLEEKRFELLLNNSFSI